MSNNDNTPLSDEEIVTLQTLQKKTHLSPEDSKLLESLKTRHMIQHFKHPNPNPNPNTLQLQSLSQVGTSPSRKDRAVLPTLSPLPNATNSTAPLITPHPPSAPNSMPLQSDPTITYFNPPEAAAHTSKSLCESLGNCLGIGSTNKITPTNTNTGGKFTKNKRRKLRSSHKKVRAKKSKHNKHKRSSNRNKRYTRKH